MPIYIFTGVDLGLSDSISQYSAQCARCDSWIHADTEKDVERLFQTHFKSTECDLSIVQRIMES